MELKSLASTCFCVVACAVYSRVVSSWISPGGLRLAALSPTIILLPLLPLSFSSIHLRGVTGFFFSWLALFKLLLLAFDRGPLHPPLPIIAFIATFSLPLKLCSPSLSINKSSCNNFFLLRRTAVKVVLLLGLISLYSHRALLHPYFLVSIYCVHVYLELDVALTGAAIFASAILRLDVEPQFDSPYRSTSLHEFWGHRWNLAVVGVLRPAVYNPVRRWWGDDAGVFAAFFVSGIMHEVMFYYLTFAAPTGEVMFFFILHGVCAVAERWVAKRMVNSEGRRWGLRLPRIVAAGMSVLFVAVTGLLLFFPQLLRSQADERMVEESLAAIGFLGSTGLSGVFWAAAALRRAAE